MTEDRQTGRPNVEVPLPYGLWDLKMIAGGTINKIELENCRKQNKYGRLGIK